MSYAALAAGIAGTASLINSYIQERRNYKNQIKIMEESNKINRSNWDRENLYNSPVAQMARLRAAGLNPNLVYQNGAVNASGSIESPQLGSNVADYSGVADSAISAYQAAIHNEQVQNQSSQIASVVELNETMKALNDANRELIGSNKYGKDIENLKGDIDLQYYHENAYQQAQNINWQTKIAQATFDKYQKEIQVMDQDMESVKSTMKLNDAMVAKIADERRKITSEIYNMYYTCMLKQVEVEADNALKMKQIEFINGELESMQQSRNINSWLEKRYSDLTADANSNNPFARWCAKVVSALYNLHDILPMSGSIHP